MRLTDIENPLVMDSSNPIYVNTPFGKGKVVGYTPSSSYESFDYWRVLPEGRKLGNEIHVVDAEIIE